ncbi:MAG: D-beta-D-heptose 7-phosphate kinase/D-beta-D-heptose 1-phosphate adenosyltransferase [Gammaproteobacteria bacterium]|jgi:D-beta-D-heptose 7-phosphate kinase/D-beta-D-heptose 1-phosphate adenosyltransferase
MKQRFTPDKTAKVLIAGDVILDRFLHGDTTRISPEAPVPVVHIKKTEERPGGAGNVALNISKLGVRTCLVSVTGKDESADTLEKYLVDADVECRFIRQQGFPTVTKLRVLSQHQQLIRLDYEADALQIDVDKFSELFIRQLQEAKVVVFSDYAKGSLSGIGDLIKQAKAKGCTVLVDPKGIDFARYQGASILTPNLKEFEAVVGLCNGVDEIVSKGKALCETLKLDALLVTRGKDGMILIRHTGQVVHHPSRALDVFDVTGAGDTVIATLAAAIASGHDLVHATALANEAAGIVVAKLGTASVTVEELNHAVMEHHVKNKGILDNARLETVVNEIKKQGETLVMTNGCFDILHAGHVQYLKRAKQLGDYLLVAVNDDASVFRLKGSGRPVNKLEDRMAVLDALEVVDWVIPFADDTPENLIKKVLPEVLVKGGDYEINEIAGADAVIKNKGEVKILTLLEGCSTSRIIESVRSQEKKDQ